MAIKESLSNKAFAIGTHAWAAGSRTMGRRVGFCIAARLGHRERMSSDSVSPPPDAASLYQAALTYLARYAATEAGLRRILGRRIDLWARAQPDHEAAEPAVQTARAAIDGIVERLMAAGAISDRVFAESRARTLVRGGRSARAVQMQLVAKGVAPDTARIAASTDLETELAAALVLARKRRIGPYRTAAPADPASHRKALAMLARAGFSRDIAEQALASEREDAEERIRTLRQ